MPDFPGAPTSGQIHAEDGMLWRYDADKGCWVVAQTGPGIEIVEADVAAGWQVWGDTLVQWGQATTNGSGQVSVVLPEEFADATYAITATAANVATSSYNIGTTNPATTGFDLFATNMADVGVVTDIDWIAIGEAPDALKKAKTVGGGSGTVSAQRSLLNIGVGYDATVSNTNVHTPAYGGEGPQFDILKMNVNDAEELVARITGRIRCVNYDSNPAGPFNASIGLFARIYYYDGVAWQALPSTQANIFQELITDQATSSIQTVDYMFACEGLLGESEIRSDLGDRWTIRIQYSPVYDPGRSEHQFSNLSWQQYRRNY